MAHQTRESEHETTTTETTTTTLDELLTARREQREFEREMQYQADKASYQERMAQQHDTFTDALNADFSRALLDALDMTHVYEPPTTTDDDITQGRWVGVFTTPEGVTFTLAREYRWSQWSWFLTSGKFTDAFFCAHGYNEADTLDAQLLDSIIAYDAWRESHAAIEAAIANKPTPAPQAAPAPRLFASVGDFLRGGNRVRVVLGTGDTDDHGHDYYDACEGTIVDTNTHWVLFNSDSNVQTLFPIHEILQIVPLPPKQTTGD